MLAIAMGGPGFWGRVGHVSLSVIACCAVLAAAAGTARAQFTWSAPIAIDKNGGVSLADVACPATTSCTALDAFGRVLTFNPRSRTLPTPFTFTLSSQAAAIACPSTSQCTAAGGGQEVTFNPASPGMPAPVSIDQGPPGSPTPAISAIACPAVTQCTAVDGDGRAVTFDPNTAGTPSVVSVDSGAQLGLNSISCPASSQCTAIDGQGREVTFNPMATGTPTSATIESTGSPARVACPVVTQCTAVDQTGREITFNPQSATTPAVPVRIDSEQLNQLLGLACPAATTCVAVSQGGREVTFNPQSPATRHVDLIDTSGGGDRVGQTVGLSDVSCPAASSCTAVDGNGQQVTFNPASPGSPPLIPIDEGNALTRVACAISTRCTAVDQTQAVSFDPASPLAAKPTTIFFDNLVIGIGALACPQATQCTVTRPMFEATFDPRRPRNLKWKSIDPNSDIGIGDVTCPSAIKCVAVDGNGGEVLFDPQNGKVFKSVYVEQGAVLVAVACPTLGQCTIIDNDGGMLTFNPATGRQIATATIDSVVGLDAPSGDSTNELDGIACPLTTKCVAVDTLGNVVTFNPRSAHGAKLRAIDAGTALRRVACPAVTECVAVDSLGRALTGNPSAGAWVAAPIAGATPLIDLACQSTIECVTVDSAGDAFVGAGRSAPQIKPWLAKLLATNGQRIGAVLRSGGSSVSFAALFAEKVQMRWYQATPGAHLARGIRVHTPLLVGSGSVSVAGRRDATLRIRLTPAGRRLLSRARKLKLIATGAVTAGGQLVSTAVPIQLAR